MNRRSFLSGLAATAFGMTLDPERLLWRSGAKLISIPKPQFTFAGMPISESTRQDRGRIDFINFINFDKIGRAEADVTGPYKKPDGGMFMEGRDPTSGSPMTYWEWWQSIHLHTGDRLLFRYSGRINPGQDYFGRGGTFMGIGAQSAIDFLTAQYHYQIECLTIIDPNGPDGYRYKQLLGD